MAGPGTRGIFVSYRREEAGHVAGRLADRKAQFSFRPRQIELCDGGTGRVVRTFAEGARGRFDCAAPRHLKTHLASHVARVGGDPRVRFVRCPQWQP